MERGPRGASDEPTLPLGARVLATPSAVRWGGWLWEATPCGMRIVRIVHGRTEA